jgi:hypothetical protein
MRKGFVDDGRRYVVNKPADEDNWFEFEKYDVDGVWLTNLYIPRAALVAWMGEDAVKRLEEDNA